MKKKLSQLILCGTLLTALCSGYKSAAQLCTGSLGDPVVNITFGAGPNPGPALSSNLTNISFVPGDCPNDGSYTIRNSTAGCFGDSWFNVNSDHTGNPNGYFMLVNASYQPSDFYVVKIDGLCTNTTYEFASWILNVLKNAYGIKPNLTFQIEETDGTILKSYNTGDISVSLSPEWKQYGFFFKTSADASSVIVRIRNNAPGGNGNDLALDDITFRPCGPTVTAMISGLADDSTSICEGSAIPIDLTGEVFAGYTNPTYQWQLNRNDGSGFIDIPSAGSNKIRVNPNTYGRYTYRLAVAEAGNLGVASCRVNSNEVNIYVRGKPIISFSPVSPTCENIALNLKANISYLSPGSWLTTWLPPSSSSTGVPSIIPDEVNNTATASFTIPSTSAEDSGYYRLRVVNLYGCTTLDSLRLLIKAKPSAFFNIATAPCEGTQVVFNGVASISSPNTITKYNWDLGNGILTGSQNPATVYNTAGSFAVSFSATGSNGCVSDTVRQQVVVHPSPTVDFQLPEVCLADPYAEFINTSAINDPVAPVLQYAWNFGDPSGNNNSSVTKDARHTYSSVGQYNVSLKALSTFGCAADTTKIFTVNGSIPKSIFLQANTGQLCSQDSVIVINQSEVDFGSITRLEIYWDYDRDPAVKTVDENPIAGRRYAHLYANTGLSGANYRVRFVVYSGINCVNESEQVLMVKKSAELVFNPVPPICQELGPFQISQASETSGISGTAVYEGRGVSSSGLFNPYVATIGDNIVTYRFTTSDGCRSAMQQVITVYPTPIVDAGPDRTILKGGQIKLNASASGEALSYLWSPSNSVIDAAVLQAIVNPAADTRFTVMAKSAEGCQATDDVLIKVVEFIAVPNAFTPNGDGRNDTWQIPYIESFPFFDVRVYNRYGQLVYEAKNGIVNWDGTVGGKPQDAGTYVYVFDRKQFGGILRGTILLIR